jgi:hypothetical protein
MLCLVSPESRVPIDHPLRDIKKLADTALRKLSSVIRCDVRRNGPTLGSPMLDTHAPSDATVGADRGYDTRDFVRGCRDKRVTAHVAQHQNGLPQLGDRRPHHAPRRLPNQPDDRAAHSATCPGASAGTTMWSPTAGRGIRSTDPS